jgi:branched-chain amino acid transport system permease protein
MNLGVFISGVVIVIAIYAIQALSLNLKFGETGLIDLGVVGYFAIGAYAFTLITAPPPEAIDAYTFALGWPLWAGFFAFLVGLPALRLRGEYLAIATYAFAEVLRAIFTNEDRLANGVVGFTNLEQPWRDNFESGVVYQYFFMGLVIVVLVLLYLGLTRLQRGPFGRSVRSIRENEPVALSVGKDVVRFKLKAFVLGGMVAGVSACFYVTFQSLIVPGMFVPEITWTVWIALVIGGAGNYLGAIVGTAVLVGAQEATRLIQTSQELASVLASSRLIIMGLILILIIRFRPKGILPERPWIDRSPVPAGTSLSDSGVSVAPVADAGPVDSSTGDTIVN